MLTYLYHVTIAVDQLVNALLGGYADETLSCRSYRLAAEGLGWRLLYHFINTLFFWEVDHCKTAYETEMARKHFPSALKNPQPSERQDPLTGGQP